MGISTYKNLFCIVKHKGAAASPQVGKNGTGVTFAIPPATCATIDGATHIQTPSQAEHGLGGVFVFEGALRDVTWKWKDDPRSLYRKEVLE